MEEQSSLVFRRWSRWVYKFRRFEIIVDDQKVGSIGDGKEVVIPVKPGRHAVELRVSWIFKSQVQILDINAGEQLLLDCGTPLSFWSFMPIILIPIGQSFMRHVSLIGLIILFLVFAALSVYYFSLYFGRGKFLCLKEPQKL